MADVVDILVAAKLAVRVSSDTFDSEIQDLIAAARKAMEKAGVTSEKTLDDSDPLIRRAITVYCKSTFGRDNSESEKYMRSFREIVRQMQNSTEYTGRGSE